MALFIPRIEMNLDPISMNDKKNIKYNKNMIALLREKKHLFYLGSSCIASFALAIRFLVENPNIPLGYIWIIEILIYLLAVKLRF